MAFLNSASTSNCLANDIKEKIRKKEYKHAETSNFWPILESSATGSYKMDVWFIAGVANASITLLM